MKNDHGQALIEMAAFFMSLAVLLGGFCGFTKWVAVRQKLLLAAKEGALLYSSGRLTRAEVESQMRQFLLTGSPALHPRGIQVSVGPRPGMVAWASELDESVASYTPQAGWHYLLGAKANLSEKFVIKHAPHYWGPLQPWGGPAVPYGS